MASTRPPSGWRTMLTVPDVWCSWLINVPRESRTAVGSEAGALLLGLGATVDSTAATAGG